MNRVRAQGDERPMAGHPQAMAALNALLAEREALYASARATVDTSGASVAGSHSALLQTVRALGLVGIGETAPSPPLTRRRPQVYRRGGF